METGFIKINNTEGKQPSVEVQLVRNTVWLTKSEMARLFNCHSQKIEANLRSIFKNNLLWENECTYNHRYMDKGIEKQCLYYNMEVLIFISYRIHSIEAQVFRQFINSTLRNELQKKQISEIKLFWKYLPGQNYWFN
jgi:Virulence protein